MIKLTWKFNGRDVSPNRVADELAKAVRTQALEGAKRAITDVRCPVHDTPPRNIRVSVSGERLHLQYDSCCDRLQETVNQRFR